VEFNLRYALCLLCTAHAFSSACLNRTDGAHLSEARRVSAWRDGVLAAADGGLPRVNRVPSARTDEAAVVGGCTASRQTLGSFTCSVATRSRMRDTKPVTRTRDSLYEMGWTCRNEREIEVLLHARPDEECPSEDVAGCRMNNLLSRTRDFPLSSGRRPVESTKCT
jgi:hypothetical protein